MSVVVFVSDEFELGGKFRCDLSSILMKFGVWVESMSVANTVPFFALQFLCLPSFFVHHFHVLHFRVLQIGQPFSLSLT